MRSGSDILSLLLAMHSSKQTVQRTFSLSLSLSLSLPHTHTHIHTYRYKLQRKLVQRVRDRMKKRKGDEPGIIILLASEWGTSKYCQICRISTRFGTYTSSVRHRVAMTSMVLCKGNQHINRETANADTIWSLVECQNCGAHRVSRDQRSCCVLGSATLEHLQKGSRPAFLTPKGNSTIFTKKMEETERSKLLILEKQRHERRLRNSKTLKIVDVSDNIFFLERVSSGNIVLFDSTCNSLISGDIKRSQYNESADGHIVFFFYMSTCNVIIRIVTNNVTGCKVLSWFQLHVGGIKISDIRPASPQKIGDLNLLKCTISKENLVNNFKEPRHEFLSPQETAARYPNVVSDRALKCLDKSKSVFIVRLHPNGTGFVFHDGKKCDAEAFSRRVIVDSVDGQYEAGFERRGCLLRFGMERIYFDETNARLFKEFTNRVKRAKHIRSVLTRFFFAFFLDFLNFKYYNTTGQFLV